MSAELSTTGPRKWFTFLFKKLLSKESLERAIDAADAMLSQVPVLGVFTAFGANEGRRIISKKVEERVQEQLTKLDRQISELGLKIDESYVTTEEFIDLWIAVAETSAKDSRESKLAMIRAIALNNLEPIRETLKSRPEF